MEPDRKTDREERPAPDDRVSFRTIFEQVAVGVAQIDTRSGRFLRVNQHYADLVGYTRQELERLDFQTLTHPEDLPADLELMRKLVAGEIRSFAMEKRYHRKNGDTVWVMLRVSPLWAVGEQPDTHLAVVEDIAERKRAEKEREQYFRFFRLCTDAMCIADPFGCFVHVNPAFTTMTGFSESELISKPFLDFVLPEDRQRTLDEMQLQVAVRPSLQFENRYVCKDGKVILLSWIAYFDKQDGVTYATARDITEQRRAEASLRANEEQLRALSANLADGMVYQVGSGADGLQRCFTFVSPAVERLHGLTVEALMQDATLLYRQMHEEDRLIVADMEARALATRSKVDVDVRIRMPSGEIRWRRFTSSPRTGPNGLDVWDGIEVDITDRKKAEAERENLQAQLIQAQKMESIGRLAGGVAHDFNNMLQAILGNVALALEAIPRGAPVLEYLEEIHRSAERSADLTRQLLAYARKQTIRPRVLDLNEAVAGALKMLRRLLGENLELIWAPGRDLWSVAADPSQIDHVLANLCVNARDAIPGAGKVTIETENVSMTAADAAAHPDCAPGDYVMLSVRDTGAGMDAATKSHLFEPFFTTKGVGKGTGLGLATVFGIVKQSQGSIAVESAPNQGTTFRIYLPRAAAATAGQAPAPVQSPSIGTETVLVAEDEEQVLKLTRLALLQRGYKVLAASSPEIALRLAQQHTEPIHLLLADVVMPGLNGKELWERLRVIHPETRCLFMSGYTADIIASQGSLGEGVRFLQKPFAVQTLAEAVRSVLGGSP